MTTYLDSTYWRLSHQVMRFAVDAQTSPAAAIAGVPVGEITEDIFYQELYAPRSIERFEESIVTHLLDTGSLVCITGPRGCGKTSAVRYAARYLRETYPEVRVVLIDVKKLWDQNLLAGLTAGDARPTFRRTIRRELEAQLFQKPADSRLLAAWLLSGPPDPSEAFDPSVLSDLHDLSKYALAGAGIESDSRSERMLALLNFFATQPIKFAEAMRELEPHLRATHLAQAFISLHSEFRRLVMIYDNVDRMPAPLQPQFLEVANDKLRSLGGSCSTAVVIRKENLRGDLPRDNEGGDSLVQVGIQTLEFPGVLLPSVSPEHVRNILEKRHAYAAAVAQMTGAPSSHELWIHQAVVSEFLEHSIARLANNSVRMISAIYTGFVEYLMILRERGLIASQDHLTRILLQEDGHLQTLFFLWIREKGPQYDITLYDVLRNNIATPAASKFTDLASVHHLMITTILNLSERSARAGTIHPYPSFGEVAALLGDLGFAFDEVTAALRDLVAMPGEQLRSVELLLTDAQIDSLSSASQDLIRLTPLGEESTRHIYHKVGYVWGSAYAESGREERSYLELTVARRMLVFHDYAVKMAERHLRMMTLLGRTWHHAYGQTWLDRYRAYFGVGGKTQVERVLESGVGFYRRQFRSSDQNAFRVVLEAYRALLVKVQEGAAFEELRLPELARGRTMLAPGAERLHESDSKSALEPGSPS